MNIYPYLIFEGNCREAMNFYHQCLGGELTIMRVSETPLAVQFPSDYGDKTVHSRLIKDSFTLMASDNFQRTTDTGNKINLFVDLTSEEDLHRLFSLLSEKGTVQMPPHQTFWGAIFAEFTDKFDIHWRLNFVKNK